MKILIHDYAGHAFIVELSRELARRGNSVLHLYAGYNITPRGNLSRMPDDPQTLIIKGLFIREPLKKYSFLKRWLQEREYGELLAREIEAYLPDVVISAQTPLDAQGKLYSACKKKSIRFIFWVQDLIGIASSRILGKKLPGLGLLIGTYYTQLERRLLGQSDDIILITDDFQPIMTDWRIEKQRIHVIPNWAAIDQIPIKPRTNPWAHLHNLEDAFCFMYTGTLGLKHNASLIIELATHFRDYPNVRVVVVSEGLGAKSLEELRRTLDLDNLVLEPYQPTDQYADVLASADVLIAMIEPEAGIFSVPSKVLSYLCAQRPILLSVPTENLAARIVADHHAGIVVDPTDSGAFIAGAEKLIHNRELRESLAMNGRQYAEDNFDIQVVADKFEAILLS